MPRKKLQPKPSPPKAVAPKRSAPAPASAFEQAWNTMRHPSEPPPTVSARWLLKAIAVAVLAAALCAWGALCLLFWQGSWQLLYHPTAALTRTPANVGLAFDPVAFATTDAGEPRLKGWWIAAAPDAKYSRSTVLYLHGQDGNLGDTVDALATLHTLGVNVLAFDYRGYGQSQFAHPSEARWREDAEWALQYLTATRHVPANAIVLYGSALGANLALEVASAHPELAGVVLESPLASPTGAVFNDPRAKLVPARLLVADRFDANAPAAALRIPSLWLYSALRSSKLGPPGDQSIYGKVEDRKMLVWLYATPQYAAKERSDALSRWLDDLPARRD